MLQVTCVRSKNGPRRGDLSSLTIHAPTVPISSRRAYPKNDILLVIARRVSDRLQRATRG